jgi:hypothetical protein
MVRIKIFFEEYIFRTLRSLFVIVALLLGNRLSARFDCHFVSYDYGQSRNVENFNSLTYQFGQNCFLQISANDSYYSNYYNYWNYPPDDIDNNTYIYTRNNYVYPIPQEGISASERIKRMQDDPPMLMTKDSLQNLIRREKDLGIQSKCLKKCLDEHKNNLCTETINSWNTDLSWASEQQKKLQQMIAQEQEKQCEQIAQYNAELQKLDQDQQTSEFARVDKELDKSSTKYLEDKEHLDKYHEAITIYLENIKYYKDCSCIALYKYFFSRREAIAEQKRLLTGARSQEKGLLQTMGLRNKTREFLEIKQKLCQEILCHKIDSSLEIIQTMDTAELHVFEQDISQVHDASTTEKIRIQAKIDKCDSHQDSYLIHSHNLKEVNTVSDKSGAAYTAVHNEICKRLYTAQYINGLQEKKAELLLQDKLTSENTEFLQAIDCALQNQNHPQVSSRDLILDQETLNWIKEQGVEPSSFTRFCGDEVGHYIFQRNVATIQKVKYLEQKNTSKPIAKECCKVVVNFCSAAIDLIKDGHINPAHDLTAAADAVYNLANLSVNIAGGFLEGTVDCAVGLAQIAAHPVDSAKSIALASGNLANFLCKIGALPSANRNSLDAMLEADETWRTAADTTIKLYNDFRQLPLEEKGRAIGNGLSFIFGPGLIAKGLKFAGAIPKVQAGMAALGRMASAESAMLRTYMLKTVMGTSLAANVETVQLVNLGGKLMSAELAETIMQTYNKIGSSIPIADFVEAFENSVMPATAFLDKTFEKVAETCSHKPAVQPGIANDCQKPIKNQNQVIATQEQYIQTTHLKLEKLENYMQKKLQGTPNQKFEKADLEHLFGIDKIVKERASGAFDAKYKGFHHDKGWSLVKKGKIKFLTEPKVDPWTGAVKVEQLTIEGVLIEDKTFFPPEWSKKMVIDKVIEASQHIIDTIDEGVTCDQVIGETKEGMEIFMVIRKADKFLVTAYPNIKGL